MFLIILEKPKLNVNDYSYQIGRNWNYSILTDTFVRDIMRSKSRNYRTTITSTIITIATINFFEVGALGLSKKVTQEQIKKIPGALFPHPGNPK